mmetsp:Transcript_29625/g.68636  ORF Transcript_29625/g.68636 Transcript_29625/m.68636 type:complete len:95 (-) Transcript_29625:1711-1995(-)
MGLFAITITITIAITVTTILALPRPEHRGRTLGEHPHVLTCFFQLRSKISGEISSGSLCAAPLVGGISRRRGTTLMRRAEFSLLLTVGLPLLSN